MVSYTLAFSLPSNTWLCLGTFVCTGERNYSSNSINTTTTSPLKFTFRLSNEKISMGKGTFGTISPEDTPPKTSISFLLEPNSHYILCCFELLNFTVTILISSLEYNMAKADFPFSPLPPGHYLGQSSTFNRELPSFTHSYKSLDNYHH